MYVRRHLSNLHLVVKMTGSSICVLLHVVDGVCNNQTEQQQQQQQQQSKPKLRKIVEEARRKAAQDRLVTKPSDNGMTSETSLDDVTLNAGAADAEAEEAAAAAADVSACSSR